MNRNLLPISYNGLNKIIYTIIIWIVFILLDSNFFSVIFFLLLVSLLYIYRNPEREKSLFGDKSVTSPVDGKVMSIMELENSEYAYKIEIESNFSNIGILRVPMNSKIQKSRLIHGSKLSNQSSAFEKINEQGSVVFVDNKLNKVKLHHLSKESFESISIDVYDNQSFLQSSRYGFMINGITTIYLPQNFRVGVNIGNELVGCETLIGYFS